MMEFSEILSILLDLVIEVSVLGDNQGFGLKVVFESSNKLVVGLVSRH